MKTKCKQIIKKQPIKIIKSNIYTIDYQDFDELIRKVFIKYPATRNFEFVADEEARNDNVYRYHADGMYTWCGDHKSKNLGKDEIKEIFDFLIGSKKNYNTYNLLNFLVYKNIISKGTYLIDVCW